jgi:hypothetical protein
MRPTAICALAVLALACGRGESNESAKQDPASSDPKGEKPAPKPASKQPSGMWTQGDRAEQPPEWWVTAGYSCPDGAEVYVDPKTEGRDAWCAQDGGRPHGTNAGVHANGAKRSLGSYDQGKRTGTWQQWYPSGQLWQEQTFADDKMHGASTMWHANGQKKREGSLEHGTRVGTWTEWDDKGAVTKTTEYVDGKPVTK